MTVQISHNYEKYPVDHRNRLYVAYLNLINFFINKTIQTEQYNT